MQRPIPVRLAPEMIKRLDRLAERSGLTRSSIIRLLVNSFLTQIGDADLSGETLSQWEATLRKLDGRRQRGKK